MHALVAPLVGNQGRTLVTGRGPGGGGGGSIRVGGPGCVGVGYSSHPVRVCDGAL